MINVKPFELMDLDRFQPKDSFEDLSRDMVYNLLDANKFMVSLIWKEHTLAVMGVTRFRKGVGEVWLLPSIFVDKCKLGFYRIVKSLIYGVVFPELGFHRLELAILKGWDQGMKWAKALGFEYSHECDAYDSLFQDHIIFKKVVK